MDAKVAQPDQLLQAADVLLVAGFGVKVLAHRQVDGILEGENVAPVGVVVGLGRAERQHVALVELGQVLGLLSAVPKGGRHRLRRRLQLDGVVGGVAEADQIVGAVEEVTGLVEDVRCGRCSDVDDFCVAADGAATELLQF